VITPSISGCHFRSQHFDVSAGRTKPCSSVWRTTRRDPQSAIIQEQRRSGVSATEEQNASYSKQLALAADTHRMVPARDRRLHPLSRSSPSRGLRNLSSFAFDAWVSCPNRNMALNDHHFIGLRSRAVVPRQKLDGVFVPKLCWPAFHHFPSISKTLAVTKSHGTPQQYAN
jgi:hypothetical protein